MPNRQNEQDHETWTEILNNEVRIISGKWKGRKLRFPGERFVRPTLERGRITLFNWLVGEIEGRRCLDLFAGSGALGFEAHSRGASSTTLVEADAPTAAALRDNGQRLGMEGLRIVQRDALAFLDSETGPWDLVFLDPPYGSDLLEKALARLSARLGTDAVIYCETREPFVVPDAWVLRRRKQLAETCMTLLEVKQILGQV